MKKILIGVLFLSLAAAASAQDFKVMIGPDMATYSGRWPALVFTDPFGQPDGLNPFTNMRTGTMNGFGVEFKIRGMWALEIDGLYFDRGATFTAPTAIFSVQKETYDLKGLAFPVLVKVHPFPRLLPYLLAGVDVSLVFSHSRTDLVLPETGHIYREVAREDLKPDTRTIDVGPIVGLGFEAPLLKHAFFLEVRYRLGLVNLIRYPEEGYGSARSRSFAVLVGYKID